MARPKRLTSDEIQLAFDEPEAAAKYPPILSPTQLAHLAGVSRSTVYHWIAAGMFAGAAVKRGKHRLIWRNRAIEILFKPLSKEGDAYDVT